MHTEFEVRILDINKENIIKKDINRINEVKNER